MFLKPLFLIEFFNFFRKKSQSAAIISEFFSLSNEKYQQQQNKYSLL